MKKAHIAALEKLFAAEVIGALNPQSQSWNLPYQSKAKVFKELEAEGLAKSVEVLVAGIVSVRGWELTVAGHLAYCLNCSEAA